MRKKVVVRAAIVLGVLLWGSSMGLRVEAEPAKPAKPPSKKELVQTFNGIYSRGEDRKSVV